MHEMHAVALHCMSDEQRFAMVAMHVVAASMSVERLAFKAGVSRLMAAL